MAQQQRQLELITPLGQDVLLLRHMGGREQLGRLFEYHLDLISENDSISFADIVGQNVTVRFDRLEEGKIRYFNGIVSDFVQGPYFGRHATYQMTMRPWFWLLTRTADCRIFQPETTQTNNSVDIIKNIFAEHGFSSFVEGSPKGPFRQRDYCVQYRETDFNFISRLMEEDGIYYYFKHEEGQHKLILADDYSAHEPLPDYSEIPYFPPNHEGARERDHITEWTIMQKIQPGKYAVNDFDFKLPDNAAQRLLASTPLPGDHEYSDFEIYDYPGEYIKLGDGQQYSQIRIEELQTQTETLQGRGNARALTTGGLFSLTDYPRSDQNREYLITAANYELNNMDFESHDGLASAMPYQVVFTVIDSQKPFRPARITPKPTVQGVQTAIVSGPGDEIYTDEHGRVKVHFHWDRSAIYNQNSSCWIRVSHPWAGKNWGAVAIPRVGQEVIVDFVEGDPDRPIITGRVYNGVQKPPYDLPANKTQSGVKSRSSEGGSPANFNEIRMEDKKGEEELYIHAEKDENVVVENDQGIVVGRDRSETIGRDRSLDVGRDKSELVGRNKTIEVSGFHEEKIIGSQTIFVGANLSETVASNYTEAVGAAMVVTVGAAMSINVGAALTETVGGVKAETVGASKEETIGDNKTLTTGEDFNQVIGRNKDVQVTKDLTETIEGQHQESVEKEYILQAQKIQMVAKDEISIKTGKAEILMKKNGDITIKGKKINVKGSGDVVIKGSKIKEN